MDPRPDSSMGLILWGRKFWVCPNRSEQIISLVVLVSFTNPLICSKWSIQIVTNAMDFSLFPVPPTKGRNQLKFNAYLR